MKYKSAITNQELVFDHLPIQMLAEDAAQLYLPALTYNVNF